MRCTEMKDWLGNTMLHVMNYWICIDDCIFVILNVCVPSGFGHLLPLPYRLKELELWDPVLCFLYIIVVGFLPRILSALVLGTCTVMSCVRLPFSGVCQNNCVAPVDRYAKVQMGCCRNTRSICSF